MENITLLVRKTWGKAMRGFNVEVNESLLRSKPQTSFDEANPHEQQH
jgi:hypothetical protein